MGGPGAGSTVAAPQHWPSAAGNPWLAWVQVGSKVNDMEIVTDLMSLNGNSMQVTIWTPSKSGSWAQEHCPNADIVGLTVALARLAALV